MPNTLVENTFLISFRSCLVVQSSLLSFHSTPFHRLKLMLVITRETNRTEHKVNIGCNHSHKVIMWCCILVGVVIQTFCQCIDLCLLRLIEHN